MDLGLQRISSALGALGITHASDVSIQVVGTNGKGSTSTFLAQILTTSGLKTGLYTSPHFLCPRERILVDGRELPETAWLEAAEAVLRSSEDRSPEFRLTYFELLTVMAAWLFREHGCAAAVFEAGLGGAHDATTALRHDLTVIAPIGLDHQAILGPTLADIARDKARAMRPGVPAVTADQNLEVMAELKTVAAETGAPLHFAGDIADADAAVWPTQPGMPGPHQAENLKLALAAHHLLAKTHCLPAGPKALHLAAREAFIPGRLQIIPPSTGWPTFILDGAHNLPGLECLIHALSHLEIKPQAVVFACLGDKDIDAMLPLVRSLTDGTIIVPGIDAPGRASDPMELAGRIGERAVPVRDMAEALRMVKGSDGVVLVCGSLYLLAEVYKLRPQWLKRR
ncbi:MAG: bifunctional folylpolyglutamate synthase/dihydrofolate synthase [Desulfovibrio sp.]|nr:bifunctional folylpolyglutamate synthase/dihydrofolate synthase [Desulfovibrio sp.]MBI4959655.1 bifunctional folylpolyglutamate synthase/dihydrofolate synthase [Desulfovibrio sp.]